jgi:hypothetical protein
MKRTFIKCLIGATAVILANSASAQLGGIGGLGGSKGGSSGGVSAEALVKSYVAGTKSVHTADAKMLSALGMKEEAAKAELQASNLTEGATASALEDAAKVQTENSKAIAAKLDGQKVTLDAEGKKEFTAGLLNLAKGIKDYTNMSSDVKSFKPSMTSIGGAASSAMFIVKSLPDNTSNLMGTLKKAISFAKENKIEVPKEATSLL